MAITTLPQLKEFVAELMEGDEFAFDVETLPGRESRSKDPKKDIPALDPRTNNVFWISLSGRGVADAIPMGHPNGPRQLMRAEVFDHLAPLFFSDRRKIGQNVKFDLLSVAKYYGGDYPPPPYGDIGVLIHVLNENLGRGGGGYNLENFSKIYLGYSYEQLGEKGVQNFPFDEADMYSYLDVKVTWLIWRKMRKFLARQPNLERVFDLEMDVLEVLLSMQKHGALVERSEFDRLDRELSKRLKEKEQEVHKIIGRPLLLTSTLQKRNYIYNELGFRTKHKTGKGEQSVAERALEPIAHKHPAIQGFLDYTHLQKMHSTYVKGFIPYVEDDDRVRASFKQTGTVTGRFSCAEPNLQNIPRKDGRVEGALIRSLFVAPAGRVLVVADYSMIELRGIAHYCQDSNLLLAFRKGIDLHTLTASKLYKKPLEQVTKEQRQSAKNAQPLDSLILTPTGWRRFGELRVGDSVVGSNGGPTKVLAVHPRGIQPVFTVRFSDGGQTRCCDDHLWEVQNQGNGQRTKIQALCTIRPKVLRPQSSGRNDYRFNIPIVSPIEFEQQKETKPLDPYLLGLLLGDGGFTGRAVSFTTADVELVFAFDHLLPRGLSLRYDKGYNYRVVGWGRRGRGKPSPLITALQTLGLWGLHSRDKVVPDCYKFGSVSERLAVLQGLLDTDGHATPTSAEFSSSSSQLIEDVIFLSRSLGGLTSRYYYPPTRSWKVKIRFSESIQPFRLARKSKVFGYPSRGFRRAISSVEPAGEVPTQCITVEAGDGLYVTDDFLLTHNCNFCLGYGGGYKKLAITGKIDEDVAKVQAADWHATYPGVRRWTKQALTKAHRNGGITTIMGRKRRLPEINSLDPKLRGAAELQAINNLIQGSAADINKMAMTRIHNMFRGTNMFLTLTVHDELIAEVDKKDAERAVGYMKEAMENIEWNGKPILSVPLEAEIHYAERWSEAK